MKLNMVDQDLTYSESESSSKQPDGNSAEGSDRSQTNDDDDIGSGDRSESGSSLDWWMREQQASLNKEQSFGSAAEHMMMHVTWEAETQREQHVTREGLDKTKEGRHCDRLRAIGLAQVDS